MNTASKLLGLFLLVGSAPLGCRSATAIYPAPEATASDTITDPRPTSEAGSEPETESTASTESTSPTSTELTARISSPADGLSLYEGQSTSFAGQASGGVPPYTFAWSFDGGLGATSGETPGLVYFPSPRLYNATLRVSDGAGDTAQDERAIECAPIEGEMSVWFGSLHGHTKLSDGSGTPSEALAWARDEAGFDFFALTDHVHYLDSADWKETALAVDDADEDGVFTALRGFEWTHPDQGDLCVFATNEAPLGWTDTDLDSYYEWFDERSGLVQLNHPARWGAEFEGFVYDSRVADNVIALETGNKTDGNNDGLYLPWYDVALAMGWRVAPTSNQDNHRLSATSHRTACLAPHLSAADVLEALAARRLYSSDDPDLQVFFRQAEHFMGDVLAGCPADLTFHIKIVDNEPIELVELVSDDGETVALHVPAVDATRAIWHPSVPCAPPTYFYVRVTSLDALDSDGPRQVAVTAPIWAD